MLDMQAVPVAEPEWSGAHVGLCLYVGRLLQPLWESPVICPPTPGESVLDSNIPAATLEVSTVPCLGICNRSR